MPPRAITVTLRVLFSLASGISLPAGIICACQNYVKGIHGEKFPMPAANPVLPEFEGWKAQPGKWQGTHIRSDVERGGMKALVSGLCFWLGTECVGSLQLKRDRDRSWGCFSGTLISSVRCFLSTRRSCSKTKPNARFTIINRYICTLYTHYANTSRPVSPPASKMRNYREGHRGRK